MTYIKKVKKKLIKNKFLNNKVKKKLVKNKFLNNNVIYHDTALLTEREDGKYLLEFLMWTDKTTKIHIFNSLNKMCKYLRNRLNSIRFIYLEDFKSIPYKLINRLRNLEFIRIINCEKISLDHITTRNITELRLENCNVISLEGLNKFRKLTNLLLELTDNCEISTVKEIRLPNLQEIIISGINISSIETLICPKLKHLEIINTSIKNVNFISKRLTKLKKIYLPRNKIEDISNLSLVSHELFSTCFTTCLAFNPIKNFKNLTKIYSEYLSLDKNTFINLMTNTEFWNFNAPFTFIRIHYLKDETVGFSLSQLEDFVNNFKNKVEVEVCYDFEGTLLYSTYEEKEKTKFLFSEETYVSGLQS